MDRARLFLLSLFACLGTSIVHPQSTGQRPPLFGSDAALTIQLQGPFLALTQQNPGTSVWLDATLKFINSDGAGRSLDVEIQARSRSRALGENCEFPSFWVRFDRAQTAGTIFENIDRVALVAPCQDSRAALDRFIFREYLAYRTYGMLTPASFRVRPAMVDYVYTDKSSQLTDRPAFFLEDDEALAQRLGGTLVDSTIVLPEFLDPAALNLAEVFQYMIGNTDFDFTAGTDSCCQGARVVAFASREGTFIPVPYDFGMSGLVEAPNARPDPRAGVTRVTDRAYRGLDTQPEVVGQTLALIRARQDEIVTLWSTTPLLKERDRRDSLRFLQEFFRELDKPEALAARLVERSRSREAVRAILQHRHKDAFDAWKKN